ncbi:interleukin-1 receptor-associated kinase 1-binding protein 1 [Elysia marginata]|uniref:Interleukin-1 receptor-associated kinase 1-binding protein 1 n=1 Tax=Elysia marginata TaxID=1093978 RepID=A0AAV4EPW4_9GAST|nr:interleukin-1 receptor-associated kinase 1-binding protein 1 [Elysia marginata]
MASDFAVTQATEKGIQEAITLSSMDRQISVSGVGELTLGPDRYSITIKCQASKDSVQDAKNSVMRRADYIIQSLHNSALKEADYQVYQHVTHSDSLAHVYYEVEAHFTDLQKCQNIANLLSEKLGPGVTVTLPRCYHARGSMDKLRRQAGMLAIHNARQKALEMAKILHLSVGPVLKVQENGTTESQDASKEDEGLLTADGSIQQRIKEATISVSSKVNVCFQLKPSKTKRC